MGDYISNTFIIKRDQIIGQGSIATVYECTDQLTQKQRLAAKILTITNSQQREVAMKESQVIHKLIQISNKNENLVKIYCHTEINQFTNEYIIIMEKCDTNLKKELQNNIKYSNDDIWRFLTHITNGYSELLQNNILHRDIKPENILLIKNGQQVISYKLADFGSSKLVKNNSFENSQIWSTPGYGAPEIIQICQDDQELKAQYLYGNTNEKAKCDIYSIGVIVYQLMCNKVPFTQFSQDSVMALKTYLGMLKQNQFNFSEIQNYSDNNLIQLVKGMITYYPKNRISIQQFYNYVSGNRNFQELLDSPKKNIQTRLLTQTNLGQYQQIFLQNPPLQNVQQIPQYNVQQITLNIYSDLARYFETLILQNNKIIPDCIIQYFKNIIIQINSKNINSIKQISQNLSTWFEYNPQNNYYQLEYLKFYFCLKIFLKGSTNLQQENYTFNNENELKQKLLFMM